MTINAMRLPFSVEGEAQFFVSQAIEPSTGRYYALCERDMHGDWFGGYSTMKSAREAARRHMSAGHEVYAVVRVDSEGREFMDCLDFEEALPDNAIDGWGEW